VGTALPSALPPRGRDVHDLALRLTARRSAGTPAMALDTVRGRHSPRGRSNALSFRLCWVERFIQRTRRVGS
jgi:hypothetical protein